MPEMLKNEVQNMVGRGKQLLYTGQMTSLKQDGNILLTECLKNVYNILSAEKLHF